MSAENPKTRIQQIIEENGGRITLEELSEIIETGTLDELKEAMKILRPGDESIPNLPLEND